MILIIVCKLRKTLIISNIDVVKHVDIVIVKYESLSNKKPHNTNVAGRNIT